MKNKSPAPVRRAKLSRTPHESDFAGLDVWARNLKLSEGRPLSAAQRREDNLARRVGQPRKPDSVKAKRLMISMTPALLKAAGRYAKRP